MSAGKFVIVVQSIEPGDSRVFGDFDTMDEAVSVVPRAVLTVPQWLSAEVVEVQGLSSMPEDPVMRLPDDQRN